jgi:arylformamidase
MLASGFLRSLCGHVIEVCHGDVALRVQVELHGRDTYLNAKLHLSDGEIATLSPLRLPPVDKPLVLAYGTAELPALVENSRSFHAYRSARHQAGALIPVPRANHFTIYDHLRPADGLLTRAVLELGRTLRA